ncbi:MAG: hypothetical protein JWQ42_278 [Edaphobacter sp.]|nr:hypothetical protein [Edaphobacter sp.]
MVLEPIYGRTQTEPMLLGTVLVLVQFDVCEEIRLDQLRTILGLKMVTQAHPKHQAQGYVHYERPPVVEAIEELVLESGERLSGEIKYYDYGVLSIIFRLPFSGDWDLLIGLASRWVWDVDFAAQAARIVRQKTELAAAAMTKPYAESLSEDYLIFHMREIAGAPMAKQIVSEYSGHIAQVVRGDTVALAEAEIAEVLQSRISYYATDLAVIGWNAAFLYDTMAGAETAIQLLEYTNSQLLEFRHYDRLLTRELDQVYTQLEDGTGTLARWRLARSATQLHTTLLEVAELTEHADNAIKFLSDMFSARLYKLAASKVGVPDYRDLVTQKVKMAEELYRFMVDQFNQSRAFFLELTVVIILVIELIFLFKGTPF